MRTLRSLTQIALVAASLATVAGCGGGSSPTTSTPEPSPKPRSLTAPEKALAQRIVETQLSNGSWAFQQAWYAPINYGFEGFQNVTGLTALSLIDAYEMDLADDGVVQDMWFVPPALAMTKDYLVEWMDDFVNGTPNPYATAANGFASGIPTNVSLPNFVFCGRYRDVFGLTPGETNTVHAAFFSLLSLRDASHGTDPAVIADGVFNRIQANRTSQGLAGLVGWDCTFVLRALVAMNAVGTEIAWVTNALKALPSLDTGLDYGLDSIAHVLAALNTLGDTSMNATLAPLMAAERNLDGSYTDSPEAAYQTTAYCLMALKAMQDAGAVQTQAWLVSRIQLGGLVYDPADDIETYEVTSEILAAIVLP
jgi:hypothetical protein